MMQESVSGQPSAEVSISSVDTDITVIYEAMTNYCHIMDVCLQDSSKMLEDIGVSLQEMKDLFLADPSYDILHERGKSSPFYDVITKQDISDMLDLAEGILRPGRHALFFCSPLHFPDWICTLQKMDGNGTVL